MIRIFFFFTITALIGKEKISCHTLELDKPLHYTATVSTGGKVSYIAYIKEPKENRPITFAFNGGPGASSTFLHLLTFGPRRILCTEEGASLLPPYDIVDNLETILDLTDLVFIDPSGTGLSKSEDTYFSIKGDIESVGSFIRDFLTREKRWNSPKYLAGESYGATRAIGLADFLQSEHGIYLNGLILVSAAIDFQTFFFNEDNQLPYFLYLPTYAATAWYHQKTNHELTLDEVIERAKNFAYETYAPTLICPPCKSITSLYQELADITGLSSEIILQEKGKIELATFTQNLLKKEEKVVGRFDGRITGNLGDSDPSISILEGALSASIHEYLHQELNCKKSYVLFSNAVNEKWEFHDYNEWGYPNLMRSLRNALIKNPSMKIFVGAGFYDLATPFLTVSYCLDHLGIKEAKIQMETYEGGHMYYLNPNARIKFKKDLIQFYQR